uniref:uncharacterized protein LOC120328298 n=1 Tax=Styela clava TaxID=7725 RepID=UPI0019398B2E|nr:uncharacterized protein LOC120328298 [Styela clava]
MGHTASRNQNSAQYRKKKQWKNQNAASKWAEEDLGRKVSALLESNAHRRDAVILPTTSEMIQSYQASRRGSAAPSENNWVKLSFNGEKDHLNWLKDQQRIEAMTNLNHDDDTHLRIYHDHSSSVSPSHSIDNRWTNSKYPKPRPKVIMNWLRDLEILISDDETEEKEEEQSPIFRNRSIPLEEEPDQDIMVSTDIPIPINYTERIVQRNSIIGVDRQSSDRSTNVKSEHGKLDLTTSAGIEPSYLMGAASSIKVLPTLPRKYRKNDDSTEEDSSSKKPSRRTSKNDSESQKASSSSSVSSESITTSSVHASEEEDGYSPPWENNDEYEKNKGVLTRLKAKGLKSSSFTGFGQRDFGLSSSRYDAEYRKLRVRNDMNFRKALQNSVTPSAREERRRYTKRRQYKPMFWSSQLNNFSLSSPIGRTKYDPADSAYDRYGRYVPSRSRIKKSRRKLTPPSTYGFDPYTDADLSEERHIRIGELGRRERHNSRNTSGIYYHPSVSDSDTTSVSSSDDELYAQLPHSSRIWRGDDQMVSNLPTVRRQNNKPTYWHEPNNSYYHGSRYQLSHQTAGDIPTRKRIEGRKKHSSANSPNGPSIPRLREKHFFERSFGNTSRMDQFVTRYSGPQQSSQLAREVIKSNGNSSLNRRHLQHRLTTSSLSDIDPALETKMNTMVRDMVYGSLEKRKPRPNRGSISSGKVDLFEGNSDHSNKNRAVGAIHERVASALASVLMSKSFPNSNISEKR